MGGAIELPPPAAGEVRVRHTAIALNFSDVNVRRGGFSITPPSAFPLILGDEAAGGDRRYRCGGRRRRAGRPRCVRRRRRTVLREYRRVRRRNVPASCLIKAPDDVSEIQAAALLLKGLTAWLRDQPHPQTQTRRNGPRHAAASGVGLLLCQWAKHLGAEVIGTVGTAGKAALVRERGCDHTILYRDVELVAAVKAIVPTDVHAVFDGVGKDTRSSRRSIARVRSVNLMDCAFRAIFFGNQTKPSKYQYRQWQFVQKEPHPRLARK